MNKWKVIGTIAFVAATTYGVAYFVREKKLLAQVTTSISNVSPKNITLSNVSVNADLIVTNPSDITFTVYGGQLQATVNGNPVADITLTDSRILNAGGGTAAFPVNISFNPVDSIQQIGGVINQMQALDLNKLNIGIKGTLSIKSGGILFNKLPIDLSFTAAEILSQKKAA